MQQYQIISIPRLSIDTPLVDKKVIQKTLGRSEDVVELHIFNTNGDRLYSETPFFDFTVPNAGALNTEIAFDPKKILNDRGFFQGSYFLNLNFQKNKIFNTEEFYFTIKEISPSRTEIRAIAPSITNSTLRPAVENFISEMDTSAYFKEFVLNFGFAFNVPGVNILLNRNTDKFEVLFKLFDPLPTDRFIGDQFKVAESIIDPLQVRVDLGNMTTTDPSVTLRGPNFDINVEQNNSIPLEYKDYDDIINSFSVTSSFEHLSNKLNNIDEIPNIQYDYIRPISGSNSLETSYHFENFTHFGSATETLKNFKYKLELLELYNRQISGISGSTSNTTTYGLSAKEVIETKRRKIIKAFNGYERFLYFDSGTYSWPKQNTSSPYILHSVSSSNALTWLGDENSDNIYYGGQLLSASLFDRENPYSLNKTIPEFIISNPDNEYYINFINMVGQHFDHVWTYIKHISEKNNTDNLKGISKELVYEQLKSLGIETFDQFENASLYEYVLGEGVSGSNFYNVKNFYNYSLGHPSSSIGFGLPVSASETLITASNDGSIPKGDITKEIRKRIYHNASYLLKTKGTKRGLRALMSCYGIPSTILNIKEYGGPTTDKTKFKTFSYDKSSLALTGGTTGSGYFIKAPWSSSITHPLTASAKTVEFRIKPLRSGSSNYHLFSLSGSDATKDPILVLNPYFGKNISSSNDSSNYGKLDLYLNGAITASTNNFPIFNGDFWNIFIGTEGTSGSGADLKFGAYQSNQLKNIFVHTASVFIPENTRSFGFGDPYSGSGVGGSEVGTGFIIGEDNYLGPHIGGAAAAYFGGTEGNTSTAYDSVDALHYSGSMQEIRYHFGELLSHDTLKKHALEPFMYAGNTISSSYQNLIYRLPLGSNNQQTSESFHPNINTKFIQEISSPATTFLRFRYLGQAQIASQLGVEDDLSITLTSTDGTVRTYRFFTQFSPLGLMNNGDLFEGSVLVKISSTFSGTNLVPISNFAGTGTIDPTTAGNFITAVNSENGHNGKIVATAIIEINSANQSTIRTVQLDQAIGGIAGNTAITYTDGQSAYFTNTFTELLDTNINPLPIPQPTTFEGGSDRIPSSDILNPKYTEFIETHHLPTPDTVGISMTSEKVRIDEGDIDGNILSPIIRSETSTLDRQPLDYEDLGVFFSPTNEINEDILYTLGSFRLDDFIGSPLPSAQTSSKYEDLADLSNVYYQKIQRKFNYKDYIKLIQNIDHTLFKMIEHWVPAKANLKTGLVIEPHILERTKFPRSLPIRSDGQTMITGSHQTFEVNLKPGDHKKKFAQSLTGSMGGGNVVTTNNMIRKPYGPITTTAEGVSSDGTDNGMAIGTSFIVGVTDYDTTVSIPRPEGFLKEQGTNFTLKVTETIKGTHDGSQGPIIPFGPITSVDSDLGGAATIFHTSGSRYVKKRKTKDLLGNATKYKKSRKYYRTLSIGNVDNIII